MNIVKELRKKKGIQQKELAMIIGVSQPVISEWESNKKDPSGERLKKLAEYFGVDELVILGKGVVDLNQTKLFVPIDPQICGISETEQVTQYLLNKLDELPKTAEARTLAKGIDKLPKEQRDQALSVVRAMFIKYADYFEKESEDET